MSHNYEFYSSLNLGKDASETQIKANYKKLSRFLHPDKQQSSFKTDAESAFSRLQYCKDILTNPTTRYIYDKYGELGANLAFKRKNITSYKFSDSTSQQDLDEKMQKLLIKTKFQQMQSEISHRSTLLLNLTISDYLSSTRSFKQTPWSRHIFQSSLTLNEIVRFNLSSRLSTDLGIVFQGIESDSACYLSTNLTYRSDSGYTGQCNYQLGKSISSTYSLSKQVKNIGLVSQVQLSNSQITPSLIVSKYLNSSTLMRLTLTAGNTKSASISVDQEKSKDLKYSNKVHTTHKSVEVNSNLSYKLTERLGLRLGVRLLSKQTKKTHQVFIYPHCNFSVKLSSLLSLGFGVEADEQGLSFVSKIRRGDFLLKIPLHVLSHNSPKRFIVGAGIAAFFSVFSLLAGQCVTSLKGAFSKSKSRAYKEAEKYKEHLVLLSEMRQTAKEIKLIEKGKKGLVIKKALYGKLNGVMEPGFDHKIIDLTYILQVAVKDSRLFLTQNTLNELSGVFEPCPSPLLYIKFSFNSLIFERLYTSTCPIILP